MGVPTGNPESLLPVTHLSFQILLALADDERHGYGIIKEVSRRTDGAIRPATGTLYAALQRMLEDGLIQEVEGVRHPDDDERRRYYGLTPFGRRVAAAEATRLTQVLGVAREKHLLGDDQ